MMKSKKSLYQSPKAELVELILEDVVYGGSQGDSEQESAVSSVVQAVVNYVNNW